MTIKNIFPGFIPSAFTLSNLLFGFLSLALTIEGNYRLAAGMILLAVLMDSLDGKVARRLSVSSSFGKELDSLCDLVSFGVAPSILAYSFLLKDFEQFGYLIAAAFATCGALRLARFNVNTGVVKGYFMGLPIPAAGCAVATFIMLGIKPGGWIFPAMVLVFAYLMVSTVKYPDFKGKGEKIRIVPGLIALAIGCYILISRHDAILFAPFFTYAIFGILNTVFGLFDSKSAV